MKNLLIVIIILLMILISAAVTNPSRDEFISWGINQIRSEAENELERVIGGAVAGPMLELQTESEDYVFFSIYRLEKSDNEIKYLGIYNNFFRINE